MMRTFELTVLLSLAGIVGAIGCWGTSPDKPVTLPTVVETPKLEQTPLENSPPETTPVETTPVETTVENTTPAPKEEPPPKKPLFVDWPKPQYVLVFSGQQQGFIEPCGCTGLANQKGGVARRMTFLNELTERGWPVVALDVGNHVRRFGRQQEVKFQRSADALRSMGYQAAAFGIDDLKLPTLEVFAATNIDDKPSLFISANVALVDRSQTPEYRVIEAGGKKIGVTSVLGDSFVKQLAGDDLVRVSAHKGLTAISDKLAAEKCDLYVLLAHATADETAELAKNFPQFQIIATSSGVGEPPLDLDSLPDTKTKQVQVGTKGMFLMVVGVFDDAEKPFRTQRVPLDDRFKDAPKMRALMAEYQDQLKALGLDGLGLKAQPHPSEMRFVGTDKCGECHTKAFAVWKDTPHAHATDTLVHPGERGDVARHFDPECLSCHTTGWEPQKMYPFATGYLGLETTPLMKQNGCENCHGPGGKHAQVEAGDLKVDAAERDRLRDLLKLPLAGDKAKNKCTECHDIDNSPEFHTPNAFEKYWKKVEHKGKD